ncbi:MAG TPA: hypothetical protein VFE23_09915, partial [Usitatibacter sp.]|nr:hypothetical protein [Usitatibacter sp.]
EAVRAAAASGEPLSAVLARDPAVRACAGAERLREALDPARYLGQSVPLARACAAAARAAAERCLRRAPEQKPGTQSDLDC